MLYKKKSLQLNSPLSFWLNFPEEERVCWYDTQHCRIVVGAGRLVQIPDEAQCKDYDFVFYGRTFFDTVKGNRWENFGNELVAFRHYYVVDGDESYYLYAGEPCEIQEQEIPKVHHDYRETGDDYPAWQSLMNTIAHNIKSGTVHKVVASREAEFVSTEPFNVESILQKLIENNPGSFIFAYQKDGKTFLGASPEVLVEKEGNRIMSYALAGTCARDDVNRPEAGNELLHDEKNVYEHNVVTDMITTTMKAHTTGVTKEPMGLMALKNLYHLRTIVRAEAGTHSLVEWGDFLHPTPAMGGAPTVEAMQIIREAEMHERGLYASPLGMLRSNGDGILIVGIRSAFIEGNHLYAYAGCGVVAQSDCDEEFKESKNKLKTILEAL